ncbi:MAG: hypothetical protein MR673_03865 [Fusobacterium perfoetens]|uniref:hypothetical protein n=1 Tax=Fusobacterium perfoetens TaxID=852 RepID=UPI0023F07068|nr:hypothetical protein [Fusobacterium perfoetens]MCI6152247.1 hypothetical protein [Fusobacterium perfoetens]MDY3237481.1 hypothetical protein [Fusobacterium perfoetens]
MSRKDKCHAVIHAAAIAAGGVGAGLAQVPCGDIIPITGIQVGMVISLAKIYNRDITEQAARNILTAVGGGMVGKQIARQLVGWIPLWGNVIKSGTAATATESVGWLVVNYFEEKEREEKRKAEINYKYGYKSGEEKTKEEMIRILEEK